MNIIKKVAIAATGLIALAIATTGCGIQATEDTTDCTVTEKWVSVGGKSSTKLIATSCGVFMVEDELSQGNWNSADVYAGIDVGKTYDFEAYGPRNGFFSLYPNVNSATEVDAQ